MMHALREWLCVVSGLAWSYVLVTILCDLVLFWMWRVYRYEWSSRGYFTGLRIITRSGPRVWLSLRLVSGLYVYSFCSVNFTSRILCHSCQKIVWFITNFSGFSRLKWRVRMYSWAVLESVHRGVVSYSIRDTLYACDVKICYNRSSFFKLVLPYESAE